MKKFLKYIIVIAVLAVLTVCGIGYWNDSKIKTKEEIELLKRLPAKFVISSHAIPPVKEKSIELSRLEEIYAKRQKGNAYIFI